MRFSQKVAIVTGGAQGMGRAYAMALAREGAKVVVADINEQGAAAVAQTIRDENGQAIFVPTDVSCSSDCSRCVAEAAQMFGGVDLLVNNAGLLSAYHAPPMSQLPDGEFIRIMSINAHSVFYMIKAAADSMKARNGGAIVNTSSVASWLGDGVYAVSKSMINALTVTFARELGQHKIRVNAVAPGPVMTDGLRQMGTTREGLQQWAKEHNKPSPDVADPEEIAAVGLFLLSDEARYVNGQIVFADGGTIIRL